MILVDTSCWVDFLRNAPTPANAELSRLVTGDLTSVAICEPIAMELLAGVTQEPALVRVEQLVNGLPALTLQAAADFRTAAAIFRAARLRGTTIRSQVDCLIAAVALRHDVEVLHKDTDFDVIASITALKARSVR